MRTIAFVRDEGHPDRPGLDTAIARALMLSVDDGTTGETFRLHTPGRVVAFGKRDVVAPGYRRAVDAAHDAGFAAVRRLAGGRAAVFHEGTLAFSWAMPTPSPREDIHARFELVATMLRDSFRDLDIDAHIGEVPGEYCPGEWSVNVGGRRKVMGVGQRLTRHAAHIGGVIVVSDPETVNLPLVGVYDALDVAWVPSATGALDETKPGLTPAMVADAIRTRLALIGDVRDGGLGDDVVAAAEDLVPDHLEPPPTAG